MKDDISMSKFIISSYFSLLDIDITTRKNPSNELHNGHWFNGKDW